MVYKMNKKLIIPIVIIVAILFFPVKVDCGVLGSSCVTAPLKTDSYFPTIDYSYDIEPVGVMLLEVITRTDFPIKYYSETETLELRSVP
jgi:hypothetical protein